MDEIERRLLTQRLAAPSAGLDRRIAGSFAVARATRRGSLLVWCSLATALAAGVVVAFFAPARRDVPTLSQTVVHHFEAQGLLREMLLNPTDERDAPRAFQSHAAVR
jgi:hypothetical protein